MPAAAPLAPDPEPFEAPASSPRHLALVISESEAALGDGELAGVGLRCPDPVSLRRLQGGLVLLVLPLAVILAVIAIGLPADRPIDVNEASAVSPTPPTVALTRAPGHERLGDEVGDKIGRAN